MDDKLSAQLDPQAIARMPRQQRARDRFEAVLAEAEKILEADGLAGFSIPVIAEHLGMTRGSVYAYFPTPYAILNELVERHLNALENTFVESAVQLSGLRWWEGIDWALDKSMAYYNAHPAARLLILGGALSDSSYRSLEALVKRLAVMVRRVWESRTVGKPIPQDPDVFTLAIDIGLSCFRRSFFEHGEIREAYKDAGARAMRGFLEPYIEGSSPKTKASVQSEVA